jgi:hypothetical protein
MIFQNLMSPRKSRRDVLSGTTQGSFRPFVSFFFVACRFASQVLFFQDALTFRGAMPYATINKQWLYKVTNLLLGLG